MKFINVLQNKEVCADAIHDDTKALQACIDELKDGVAFFIVTGGHGRDLLDKICIEYSTDRKVMQTYVFKILFAIKM